MALIMRKKLICVVGQTFYSYGTALAEREIGRIEQSIQTLEKDRKDEPLDRRISLLHTTIQLFEQMASSSTLHRAGKARLWHTDLHMGNIFVSKENPSDIVGIIDWQSMSILPLFLQTRYPVFLTPPEDYEFGLQKPKLREDFHQLTPEDQKIAAFEHKRHLSTKAYELSSMMINEHSHHARSVPRVIRELYVRCGEVWEMGATALEACLVEVLENWEELDISGECQVGFSEDEIARHKMDFKDYKRGFEVQTFAQECLDTDAEGWIPPVADVDEKRKQNKELFELYLEQSPDKMSREELLHLWPFPLNTQTTIKLS